jgi:pimeloyl-ACP methyl ester carboxylesterase
MFKYGFFGLFLTRFFNEEVAEKLAKLINVKSKLYEKVIVLGHSNGCAIAHLASYICEGEVAKFVYINPALKKELIPSINKVAKVDVYHNSHDKAVLLSKLLFWKARERPWGIMGNVGYQGIDQRFTNYDTEHDFKVQAEGHSAVFEKKNIKYYGPLITAISVN